MKRAYYKKAIEWYNTTILKTQKDLELAEVLIERTKLEIVNITQAIENNKI